MMEDEEDSTGQRSGAGAVEELVATWRRVVTDPHGFLAEMPQAGGLREPGLFLVVCAGLAAAGYLLRHWTLLGALGFFVVELLAAVLLATLLVLIAQHLFDGKAGFEPTFRLVAYAWAPLVFAWVPLLGGVPVLYAAYILVRGIESVQHLDALRAVLTVVIGAGGLAALAWLA